MATTVNDLINQAFYNLGVIRPGDTPTAAMIAAALLYAQEMELSWLSEELSFPKMSHQAFGLLAGTSAYTLSTNAASTTNIHTAYPPVKIIGASSIIILTGGQVIRNPVELVSFPEFEKRVADPIGTISAFPKLMATDQASDNSTGVINIKIWPVPGTSPASLDLDYWLAQPIILLTSSAVDALPPAWQLAIQANLTLLLAPQFAREGADLQLIAANAQNAKQTLVTLNRSILNRETSPTVQAA